MDLFKLLGIIEVDNSKANQALEETSSEAKKTAGALEETGESGGKTGSKWGTAFKAIGKGAVAVGKTVAVGMTAAATGIGALATKSVQAYADYEQLVGGVETLFKDSAKTILEYAENAYKTAGISANEYMETVTSFSASLLQSLDGDTKKAAEYAQQAITDMSDNANKMGTDMSMIQSAYQGFAKQNYTMLDNLKLGYGGTQEEMYRLMQDAEKLGAKFNSEFYMTEKGTLVADFADITTAIHAIQTEMGITGTTAKEASSTISGSIASMKSSWQNLLTAISSDEMPFQDYVTSFVESVSTVANNLMPRIQIALNGVVQLIEQLAPVIIGKIPELFNQLLPSVISAATGLINSLVAAFPDIVSALMNVIPSLLDGIVQIVNTLISALPSLMQMVCSALPTLIPALVNGLVSMIVTLCTMLPQIIQPIINNLPQIIKSLCVAIMNNLPVLINGLIELIIGLVDAIPSIVQALIDSIPYIIEMVIVALLDCSNALIAGAIRLVFALVAALPQIMYSLNQALPKAFLGIWNSIKTIFQKVPQWFCDRFNAVVEGVAKVFLGFKDAIVKPFEKARDTIKGIADKIRAFFKGEIKMPKIKMPHFKVSPSGWKIGDLLKGSIPKLGVEWYAKAMNNPMIMTKPTIFGYNAGTGELMGGGENGSEVVTGTNTLMRMIQSAVSAQNDAVAYYLQKLIEILADYFPQILEAAGHDIVLDDGTLVSRLAPGMDKALGKLASRKGRGRND